MSNKELINTFLKTINKAVGTAKTWTILKSPTLTLSKESTRKSIKINKKTTITMKDGRYLAYKRSSILVDTNMTPYCHYS